MNVPKLLGFLTFSLLYFALSPSIVQACSCVGWTEEQYLANSDYAFEGYVYNSRLLETDSVFGSTSVYIFKNLEIMKGANRMYVEVLVTPGFGSCPSGMFFSKNIKYRVYASERDGRLYSGHCSSSRVVSE